MPEVLRAQPVVHVADEDAVLDQHVALARVALVVDVDRAARVGDRAVVDHGAQLRRDQLAELPGVVRRLLAVEVGLEPVADRLVQQDARVAGAEHDRHLARRCIARVEHRDRDPRRLAPVRRGIALRRREVVHAVAATAAARARLALAVLLGDRAHAEPHQRLDVRRHPTVAGEQQHLLDALGERRLDLDDPRIVARAPPCPPARSSASLSCADTISDGVGTA